MEKRLMMVAVLFVSGIIVHQSVFSDTRYRQNTIFSNVTLQNCINCRRVDTFSLSLSHCALVCSLYACDTFYYDEDNGHCSILVFLTDGIPLAPNGMDNFIVAFTACQPGWLQFMVHCIFFNQTRVTWQDAKDECHQRGAKLIDLQSDMVNDFVVRRLFFDGADSWICARKTDVLRWEDNSVEVDLTSPRWANNNPDNTGRCMQLWKQKKYTWDDNVCYYRKRFICQLTKN